jgi:hypothetical protein
MARSVLNGGVIVTKVAGCDEAMTSRLEDFLGTQRLRAFMVN